MISKKIKLAYYYLPIVIWLGLIYYFSSIPNLKTGSESLSIEIFLRKGAHFVEFFVLAYLIFRIFYALKKNSLWRSCAYALLTVMLIAIADEYHQSFVVGRSGNINDIFFDFLSAFIFFQIIFLIKTKKKIFSHIIGILIVIILLIGIEIKMIDEGRKIQEENKLQIQSEEISLEEKVEMIIEEPARNASPASNASHSDADWHSDADGEKEKELPEKILIKTPFTTQAPYAVWDEYHEEACEEASLIMIEYFLKGKALNQSIAEKEIQDLIKFQIKEYGDYKDSSAQELVRLANEYYGIKNLKVIYDFSKTDLKKYLSNKKPIIIPAAGRLLGNPYFTPPGPLYHNLVLIGYNEDKIITNDPGTKRGEGYIYDIDILYNAIHDFTGKKEDIEKGRKAMIIIQ